MFDIHFLFYMSFTILQYIQSHMPVICEVSHSILTCEKKGMGKRKVGIFYSNNLLGVS